MQSRDDQRAFRSGRLACTAWLAVAAISVLALAGCSSSSKPSASSNSSGGAATPSGPSAGSTSSSTADPAAAAQAALQKNFEGTDGPVPASGPAAATNKSIWVITCGQAAAGCATPGNATVTAAKAIGWKATLCDGKLNPATYAQCVSTAAAAKPSAIVLVAVDCQFVKAPLAQAKKSGIKIFGVNSFDCSSAGAANLFDGDVHYHGFSSFADYVQKGLGKSTADYIIANTGAKAKTLIVREDDNLSAKANIDGIQTELQTCKTCSIQTLSITVNDLLSGGLADKVNAALNKYPDVDVVSAPYDAAVSFGIAQGIAKSGRHLMLTGLEGLAANIDLIKKGQQTESAGTPSVWIGWAAVDSLNRLFAGQPLVDEGIGYQTIDKSHNLPTTTAFYDGNVDSSGKPKQDYRSIYLKSWGK